MSRIIIKNSTTAGTIPSSLAVGELAINTADGKLYYSNGSIVKLLATSGSGGGGGGGTGTVTSVQLANGTGISLSGTNPITTAGTITITNSAPDQTVVLNNGTGISVTGTYPTFTINNTVNSSTFLTTSSFNNYTSSTTSQFAGTASYSLYASQSLSASYALTASLAPNYVLTSVTSSMLAPYVLNSQTGSFATTGSNNFKDNQTITGSISISGSGVQAPLQVWSGSTSLLFVSSSGNVGIGTSAPTFKLDVNGTARAVTSLQTPTLLGNTTSGANLTLQSTSNATKGKILFGASAYDEVNNRLGINTTSPANTLDVIRGSAGAMGRSVYETAAFSYNADMKFGLYCASSNSTHGAGLSFGQTNLTITANGYYPGFDHQYVYGSTPAANAIRYNYTERNSTGTVINYAANLMQVYGDGKIIFSPVTSGVSTTIRMLLNTSTDAGYTLDVNGTTRIQNNVNITGSLTVSSSAATGFRLNGNQLLIPSQSGASVAITVSGSNTRGGTGYVDFLQVTNTSASIANPNKYFRLNTTGDVEIVSSDYGTTILSLTNAGVLSTPGGGTSDARKKSNIYYVTSSAYEIVSQLKPTSFEFNNNPGVTRHGFIAQDILPIKPDLVLGDGDEEGGTYGLDYEGILALTVKSLQEATARIDQLEQEIQLLKNK